MIQTVLPTEDNQTLRILNWLALCSESSGFHLVPLRLGGEGIVWAYVLTRKLSCDTTSKSGLSSNSTASKRLSEAQGNCVKGHHTSFEALIDRHVVHNDEKGRCDWHQAPHLVWRLD